MRIIVRRNHKRVGNGKLMRAKNGEYASKIRTLEARKKRHVKAHRILARTHISHGRLTRIIESYAQWETAGMAAKRSGVSRISVARIYNLIRKRLLDCGIYISDETYRNDRYDMENDEAESQPWFEEESYRAQLARMIGRYRGIDPAHYALYEAEAVFRVTRPQASEGEVKTYIMEAIRITGPLNEEPYPERLAEVILTEFLRREMTRIGTLFKHFMEIPIDDERAAASP